MLTYQTLTDPNYESLRLQTLFLLEVGPFDPNVPIRDTEGIATIGIGFNLQVDFVRDAVLAAIGFDVDSQFVTGTAATAEEDYIAEIETAAGVAYATHTAVREALDDIMSRRSMDSRYTSENSSGLAPRRSAFVFSPTDTTPQNNISDEIDQVFDNIIVRFENDVNNLWAARANPQATDPATIPNSRERVAIVSLVYNSGAGANTLFGPSLKAAMQAGDRAEAWYEIRYNVLKPESRRAGSGLRARSIPDNRMECRRMRDRDTPGPRRIHARGGNLPQAACAPTAKIFTRSCHFRRCTLRWCVA